VKKEIFTWKRQWAGKITAISLPNSGEKLVAGIYNDEKAGSGVDLRQTIPR